MKALYTILHILLFSGLLAVQTQAQTSYSSVAGTGTIDWNSPSSWVGGVVPPTNLPANSVIYIRYSEMQITADITFPNRLSIIVTGSGVINVRGNNTLTLTDNASEVVVWTGGAAKGQSNNSVIQIGTGSLGKYTPNGGGNTAGGPTRLTSGGSQLPVTLLYFNATAEGTRVSLAWATTEELGAKLFVVERSPNLGEFITVGTLTAAGTTQIRQNYGLIDTEPLRGTSYYRLRQVDHSGAVNYSKPVAVNVIESAPGLLVLGNPVRGSVIRLSTQNLDGAAYKLATLSGQLVDLQINAEENGDVSLTPNRSLPMGLYLLTAQSGAIRVVRKLLVE